MSAQPPAGAGFGRKELGAVVLAVVCGMGGWALTRISMVDSLDAIRAEHTRQLESMDRRIAALESLCGHR